VIRNRAELRAVISARAEQQKIAEILKLRLATAEGLIAEFTDQIDKWNREEARYREME
jgi:hypothetical protein